MIEKAKDISDKLSTLIESGDITDEGYLKVLKKALAFIESPTNEPKDFEKNTSMVGMVLAGYMMSGADEPPEINELHAQLLTMQCDNKIKLINNELDGDSPDQSKIAAYLADLKSAASCLADGHKNNPNIPEILNAIAEIEARLDINPAQEAVRGKIDSI